MLAGIQGAIYCPVSILLTAAIFGTRFTNGTISSVKQASVLGGCMALFSLGLWLTLVMLTPSGAAEINAWLDPQAIPPRDACEGVDNGECAYLVGKGMMLMMSPAGLAYYSGILIHAAVELYKMFALPHATGTSQFVAKT